MIDQRPAARQLRLCGWNISDEGGARDAKSKIFQWASQDFISEAL
jgi:hypothetical protein